MQERALTAQPDELPEPIRRAVEYIDEHYDEKINLAKLAKHARLSKYYFHRLFRAHLGETVHERLCRVRLEHAQSLLVTDVTAPVARIAEMCGFSSPQNFARAYKTRFGVSPTTARRNGHRHAEPLHAAYTYDPLLSVTLKELPPCRVAYIRNMGQHASQKTLQAFEQLTQWAISHQLSPSPSFASIAAGWSDITTTPRNERILDACLPVGENVEETEGMPIQCLPGGSYAVVHCEGGKKRIASAWNHLLTDWLPKNGYHRDERPVYFIYYNNPHMNPRRLSIMDLCLPVKPAASDL